MSVVLQSDPRPLAVSIDYTCEATSLSKRTVYRLIESGQLRTRKIGRRTLVLMSSIDELLYGGDDVRTA